MSDLALARQLIGGTAGPQGRVDPGARVHPQAHLAQDVGIAAGAHVGANARIAAGCRLGANVVLIEGEPTVLGESVHVGANATILDGLTLGTHSIVRPGSVVQRSVPPRAIVAGNPAAIVGYADAVPRHLPARSDGQAPDASGVQTLPVRGVTLHRFPVVHDLRGALTVGEFGPAGGGAERHVPFAPRRWFMVYDVPSEELRGEHAHRACHQFLICARGRCAVVVDDGQARAEVALDAPSLGLYLPPLTWGIQYRYSADAILLVYASHAYDPDDYIRDYDAFRREVARRP